MPLHEAAVDTEGIRLMLQRPIEKLHCEVFVSYMEENKSTSPQIC